MFDKEFDDLKKILDETRQVKPKEPMTEEEEANEIVHRLKTQPMSPSEFRKMVIPMIRKLAPTLVANDIIGVQPGWPSVDEFKK